MTHAADTYTKLCDDSSRLPDVFDFLSKSTALSEQEVLDVVLVDQYHRWKQNQSVPVEHYLSRIPEIGGVHAVPLAVEEYGHLEERGVAPAPSEFVQRYLFLGPEAMALLCEELDVDASSSPDSPETPTANKPIGRYKVVCSIGCGAFGEVFLGKDPDLERSVAIKVLNRQQSPTGNERSEQLLREARLIAQLDHPNIVPIFDFGTTDDGDCYIVSKYVRGQELKADCVSR